MTTQIARRLVGTVSVIMLLAVGFLVVQYFGRAPSGSYQLTAQFEEAGKGLESGSDVKIRGVFAGTVKDIRLDDRARPVATLEIQGQRIPKNAVATVTSKTFLGSKIVAINPQDANLDQGPYYQPGDTIEVTNDPSEVQDFLAALDPHLEAIDPLELSRVVDAFGTFTRDDARIAGENIDLTRRLATFQARTSREQLARFESLRTLTGELATTAEDFNRLNRSLPRWVSLLPDRQADVRANLNALTEFSLVFADFLETEEDQIDNVLDATTAVNRVVAARGEDLAAMIQGIHRYALKLAAHGGSLNDGSEYGWFTVMIGGEGTIGRLCESLPEDISDMAPGCTGQPGDEGGDAGVDSGGGSVPTPSALPSEIPTERPSELPSDLPTGEASSPVPFELPGFGDVTDGLDGLGGGGQ